MTTILFYPQKPANAYTLFLICEALDYQISNDPRQHYDIAISWHDITFRNLKYLDSLTGTVINKDCNDISKEKVDEIFTNVFGYSSLVDPKTYDGEYVKKKNINGLRDGRILSQTEIKEEGYIYQKLVNNEIDDMLVEDLRVFIIKGKIVLLQKKTRFTDRRFGSSSYTAVNADYKTEFSKDEITKIESFCVGMGMDYGELDACRDSDGKLYIIDANNTPIGFTHQLSKADCTASLIILKEAFKIE